ncbi:MAG: D-alanyl-D-alanine carboxypeptidase family protein [Rhodanobacteraceae bacterium]|nr:MAG: D-alanyl-D-alanine carboxypeptidase family protein [Rhodanobacteraceae bacterium]
MLQGIETKAIGAEPPARCRSSAARRALLARASDLGVPRGYARARRLRLQREPARLAAIGTDVYGRTQWLQPRAAGALAALRQAALRDGVVLEVVSAFRSIEYQLGILQRKLARGQPMAAILRVSAAPGYSEHHSGRCVDLTTPGFAPLEETFEQSRAFAWLTRHAATFGFALSYPRGNPHAFAYEPWHWCWHAQRAGAAPATSTTRHK